jgi:coenzyme Q-binding protein COQ10
MPSHTETRILPYSAEQLFDLVMDIEKYPEFLPWCLAARVKSRTKDTVEADVIIGYKVFREKFSSRVRCTRAKSIDVEYMQGPMRHLQNKWEFRNTRNGECRVGFYVDFSMKTRLFETLVDQFFQRVLVRMINAFETRALELYGAERH